MRVCRETLRCYSSETALPIGLKFGMWVHTHQPNPQEESQAVRRRARARAYPIYEFEEFRGLYRGNGWTDSVKIWYVGKGSPAQ